MPQPSLTFFCELDAPALQRFFDDPRVWSELTRLGASVSLGILDLSPERAGVVRRLNYAHIPVTAWLLLPKDQGYWFNLRNSAAAAARYADFSTWAAQNALRFEAVGLDIEPDIHEMNAVLSRPVVVLPRLIRRLSDRATLQAARQRYDALLAQIRADGFRVESYQFAMIADERLAGGDALQRLSGILDLPVDREVWMLYSSFLPGIGPAVLSSYAPQAAAIGLGSSGGGVEMPDAPALPVLSWAQLKQDLLIAAQHTPYLYIFSLEGCRQSGYLDRFAEIDWSLPPAPVSGVSAVNAMRTGLRALLWGLAHPARVVLGGLGVAIFLGLLFHRRKS